MTKFEFIELSIQMARDFGAWMDNYPEHTQLTKDQLVTIEEAKEIIGQVAVRVASPKGSSLH